MKSGRNRLAVCLLIGLFLCCFCAEKQNFVGFGVTSDVDPLRRVIVLTPGEGTARQSYWFYMDEPLTLLGYDEGAVSQHDVLKKTLMRSGVEVLEVRDLLENALQNARAEGSLEQALEKIFPTSFTKIRDHADSLTADDLLGRSDDFYYVYDQEERFMPIIDLALAFYFTRDFAAMTPRGLILTNAKESWRSMEHRLGRFLFTYSDNLRECPILFDAEKEDVYCEGGDILVRDEKTIFMGVNNFSDSKAAQKIAIALDMDVIGVAMPPHEDFSGANMEIMHLDTVFNFVDRDKILAVPYIFEKEYADENPMVDLLLSVERSFQYSRELQKPGEVGEGRGFESKTGDSEAQEDSSQLMSLAKAVKYIPDVGWLTRYKAGSGEPEDLRTKLVDYLREEGYQAIWVGGDRGDMREDKYIMERVFYEQSLQAANVVQLAPGKVLAYAHNRHTIQALRDQGVEVVVFEGKYLADGLGGPHCLTMPVLRK